MSTKKILVTGATGQQGGAVVRALLASPPPFPFEILALTRNTTSAAAQSVSKNNPKVTLLQGDLDHSETLFEKAGGRDSVWGVFLVTVPSMKKGEEGLEERQGKTFIDAAVNNGVKHLVFSSVDRGVNGDTDPTPIAHFVSKYNIEKHLLSKIADDTTTDGEEKMTYTILRPVAFLDNLDGGMFGSLFASMWRNMSSRGPQHKSKLQLVSTRDIGTFASLSFSQSTEPAYKNTSIALAGDELTQSEAGDIFIDIIKRPMPRAYSFAGNMLQWMAPEVGIMFCWFGDVGYAADVAECRRLNPNMMDFRTWLKLESNYRM